jgi:RNA polymerase sigma-70 factor (ECF subfamily)
VQESFAHAIVRRYEYRGEGPLDAWLWRIVVNQASNWRRRERLVRSRAGGGPYPDGAAAPDDAPGDPLLRDLISALPERQRLALFLRYYADLDYERIASALDIRPGTVGATLNAAHRALRGQLQAVGAEAERRPR